MKIAMPYELHIRKHNEEFHKDLDIDLTLKKNGLYSCIIKVHDGDIIDYVVLEYDSFEGLVV